MTAHECAFASSPQRSLMTFRVLLADSDIRMLDMYRRFFGRCWYEVDTAASGVQCVAALRAARPDVLVMNRNLLWGGFDGVMDHLREDCEMPPVPVVAIEEHKLEPTPHDAQIIATLTTPFRVGDLDRLLRYIFTKAVAADR